MIRTLVFFFKSYPINVSFWKIKCRIFGSKIHRLNEWQKLVAGKKGIEIGGPSGGFNSTGYIPLYKSVLSLDGINFSSATLWEGKITEGNHYTFEGRNGYQFIAEGSYLPMIADNTYDFVLSCNNLEHIANPIKAIVEWKRIICGGGVILLILPNKHSNFDHRRPLTTFEHVLLDFEQNTKEDDFTHLEEILQYHDLNRDPRAGSLEQFKQRCLNNLSVRGMHHHVFSPNLLRQITEYAGMKVLLEHTSLTDYYLAVSK